MGETDGLIGLSDATCGAAVAYRSGVG